MFWIRLGPWIHLILIILLMVVIPTLTIIDTLMNLSAIHSSVFQGPLLIYPFISACVLIQFPIYILPRLKKAAEFVKNKKDKMAQWTGLKKALK